MSSWERDCTRLWMDVRFLSSSVFFVCVYLFVFVLADFSSYIVLFHEVQFLSKLNQGLGVIKKIVTCKSKYMYVNFKLFLCVGTKVFVFC